MHHTSRNLNSFSLNLFLFMHHTSCNLNSFSLNLFFFLKSRFYLFKIPNCCCRSILLIGKEISQDPRTAGKQFKILSTLKKCNFRKLNIERVRGFIFSDSNIIRLPRYRIFYFILYMHGTSVLTTL